MKTHEKTMLIRPEHLNHVGTLFGGYMMQWADEMAYVAASQAFPHATFVTKSFDEFRFTSPARQGDIIKIYSKLCSFRTTSCVIDVWAMNATTNSKVFNSIAVMVNFNGKEKVPLPAEDIAQVDKILVHED